MAVILTSRYSDLLRKLCELQGELRLDLIEQLRPVIVLENDRPEWFFLRRERLASGFAQGTGAAGTLAEVGIFNPSGSGRLVVVTRFSFYVSGASLTVQRRFLTALPAGAVVSNSSIRDTRLIPGGPFVSTTATAAQIYQATPAAADGSIADTQWIPAINVPIEAITPRGEVTLTPGSGLQMNISGVGVNTLTLNGDWYEKLLGAEA